MKFKLNPFTSSLDQTLSEFTELSDVPSTYVGQSLKEVRVNSAETALEFATSLGLVDGEVPSGTINGVNSIFTLANTPSTGSLKVYLNGFRLTNLIDFTLSGSTITMLAIPFTGDIFVCDYRF